MARISTNRAWPLVIVLITAACSAEKTDPVGMTPGIIEGAWQTSCLPFGKNGRHGMITAVEFESGRMRAVLQAYEKPDCETPTFHSTYAGNYVAQPEGRQIWRLDHTVVSITLEIDHQSVVDWYNDPANDGCGLKSWELNVPKNIEGRLCKPVQFPVAGETLFDKVSVSSGEIRFGHFPLEWTAKSESERPELAEGVTFRRVSG